MADLLTHVLVGYVVLTVASWRVDWLSEQWVVLGMAGTALPDLVKLDILVDDEVIEGLLGVPFSYTPLSTLGGVLVSAAAVTLLFRTDRRRVYGVVLSGAATALVLDGLRVFADGRADFWLYPLWWRPPTPSLYVTSDPRVLAVALIVSGGVFLVDRYVVGGRGSERHAEAKNYTRE